MITCLSDFLEFAKGQKIDEIRNFVNELSQEQISFARSNNNAYAKDVLQKAITLLFPDTELRVKVATFNKESLNGKVKFNGSPVPLMDSSFKVESIAKETVNQSKVFNYLKSSHLLLFVSDEGMRGRDAKRGSHRLHSYLQWNATEEDIFEFAKLHNRCRDICAKGNLPKVGLVALPEMERQRARFVTKNRGTTKNPEREFAWTNEFLQNLFDTSSKSNTVPTRYDISMNFESRVAFAETRNTLTQLRKLVANGDSKKKLKEKPSSPRHEYERSEHVKALALLRANRRCEALECAHPLFNNVQGNRYVEVHHFPPLRSDDGEDVPEKIICLCPAHHREAHYGEKGEELVATFPSIRRKNP